MSIPVGVAGEGLVDQRLGFDGDLVGPDGVGVELEAVGLVVAAVLEGPQGEDYFVHRGGQDVGNYLARRIRPERAWATGVRKSWASLPVPSTPACSSDSKNSLATSCVATTCEMARSTPGPGPPASVASLREISLAGGRLVERGEQVLRTRPSESESPSCSAATSSTQWASSKITWSYCGRKPTSCALSEIAEEEGVVADQQVGAVHRLAGVLVEAVLVVGALAAHAVA